MQNETSTQDLATRVALIESMIAEGRRGTESWGWTFLLWGLAYYVAIGWSTWGNTVWGGVAVAWPVTMIAAVVLTIVIGARRSGGHTSTTMGRAVSSIWIAVGTSMLLLFPALGSSGRLEPHAFVAMIAAMLGFANGASGLILKWKMQFACAVVWWAASIAACFGSERQLMAVFLGALFFCQIVFGIYAMIRESSRRKRSGVVHA